MLFLPVRLLGRGPIRSRPPPYRRATLAPESSVLAQDASRTIPDLVLLATTPPPKELWSMACVGSRAKPGSNHSRRRRAAWSVERLSNEVIFSKNDSTYDVVGR